MRGLIQNPIGHFNQRSFRPPVKRVNCDKTEERYIQIFIPYGRSFSLVFWEEEIGGATPSSWNFGSTVPRCNKIVDFEPIFARSASCVTPKRKSSINTNSKSTIGYTHFLMSLRWSSHVAPKGAQKLKTANFGIKSHFAWRKSATKFRCVKTVRDKVVKHSLA